MGSQIKTWLKYVAANVRRLRVNKGLTQEQLGELAAIDPRYVQDVERARTNFSFTVFISIAEALSVPPSRLLRPAKMMPPVPGRPPATRSRKKAS